MGKEEKAHYELQDNLYNAMSKANNSGLGMVHVFHTSLCLIINEIYKSSPDKKEANTLIKTTIKEVNQ